MKKNILFLETMLTSFLVKNKTRKPVSDIQVRSQRYSKDIQINISMLRCSIIDGELDLHKNNGLIGIEIEGEIKNTDNKYLFLNEIELIEKISKCFDSKFEYSITIDIVPSLTYRKNRDDKTEYFINGSTICFKTKIEHRLYSCGFGKHAVKLHMGDKMDELILQQPKYR